MTPDCQNCLLARTAKSDFVRMTQIAEKYFLYVESFIIEKETFYYIVGQLFINDGCRTPEGRGFESEVRL